LYANPVALQLVSVGWLEQHGVPTRVIEEHHAFCRNHDGKLTAPLCRNCHWEIHEGLWRASVNMRTQADPIARVIEQQEASAVFLEHLAEAQRRSAALLRQTTRRANDE
jgi:hypothetical protein